jgi:hypothetical protein
LFKGVEVRKGEKWNQSIHSSMKPYKKEGNCTESDEIVPLTERI